MNQEKISVITEVLDKWKAKMGREPYYCGLERRPDEIIHCGCMGCVNDDLRKAGITHEEYKEFVKHGDSR